MEIFEKEVIARRLVGDASTMGYVFGEESEVGLVWEKSGVVGSGEVD